MTVPAIISVGRLRRGGNASRYAVTEGSFRAKNGPILLQDHGARTAFRNTSGSARFPDILRRRFPIDTETQAYHSAPAAG